ncbi:Fanconi anemia group I protein-like [Gracilariopsis chorda]|uniref:Fanconi anemia group I protein-like n=1 Tax=Gracilariopsis chorda TaxID=448386 RepID=A0A2V3IXD8_9FLOR|nr:Fanconi anemia group I protein-like [Gracilariopsis chorda]|eukprot:PXF46357.1 Fanconi anemia group I protein-like [Gracilariopsis chorda]
MVREGSKVDNDANVAQHFESIKAEREAYLLRAAKRIIPIQTRQRIVEAALRYLESRSRQSQPSQSPSQSIFSQGPNVALGQLSSFQSVLSSLLTAELPPETLIDVCVRATDGQFLPIAQKGLSLLATIGPIGERKSVKTENKTRSEQEDEQLVGNENEENEDPQNPISSSSTPSRNQILVRRTGQSFVDEFVSKLTEQESRKATQARSNDIFVVSVAREVPLSDHAAEFVFSQLVHRMSKVELLELPAFIYQLLLYASSRGNSYVKRCVLVHIARVFSVHEEKSRQSDAFSQNLLAEDEDAIVASTTSLADLRQVQGTALLHIEYAVKQDPSLSGEIVSLAKAGVETPKHFLTAFGTGMVLSLAKTVSIRTDVLQVLREVVSRFDKEVVLRKRNLFMARVSMNDEKLINPCNSLLHIAECTCENGWDYVKESLLQFAFVLLDKPLPTYYSEQISASGSLVDHLFIKLFNAHPAMRSSILEQLTTRIALQEKSAMQAISIIKVLAEKIPYFVLEHIHHIRDGMEIIVSLPPWMASSLIQAYKPLLLTRQDLQDYFQLIVRKSLFHREVSSRAVSIIGFLTLVPMNKVTQSARKKSISSKSQSTCPSRRAEKGIDGIMESFQPLRRVFSYPAALKAFWYMNAIQHLNAIESRPVMEAVATGMSEVFVNHLRRFVDVTKAPYLLLDHCVDMNGLVEPLGELVWCLAVVEFKKDPVAYSQHRDDEDFANAPENDENNPKYVRNKVRALGSVCEALIHAVFIIPKEQQKWSFYSDIAVPLLTLKGQLLEILGHARVASASDSFLELGGIATLERLRPGLRLMLQRSGKSSRSGKKGQSRKGKSNDTQASSAHATQNNLHKFGVFNVLASSSSKPSLPLKTSIQILQQMTDAEVSEQPSQDIFQSRTHSKEFQELRLYLLAVTKKHIENFSTVLSKPGHDKSFAGEEKMNTLMRSVNVFVNIVMSDFKKFRRSSSDISRQGGLKALQAAESCTSVLPFIIRHKPKALSTFCKALTPVDSDFDNRTEATTLETAVELLEGLIDNLIEDAMLKEVTVALHIRDVLVKSAFAVLNGLDTRSGFLTKRVQWSVDALSRKKIADDHIVKTLVCSCLVYTENNNDMRRANDLCVRLLSVVGDCDANMATPDEDGSNCLDAKLSSAVAIEKGTCFPVVEGILDAIESAISDVEWCLSRMSSLEAAAAGSEFSLPSQPKTRAEDKSKLQEEVAKQSIRAEDAALLRLEGVVRALRGLTTCAIGKWGLQERLLRLVTKTYKVLCLATGIQAKRKGDPRTSFISLINEVKGLAPTLWTYLAFIGADSMNEVHQRNSGRAASEARVMPQLIYEVERFEKVLISAQKRTTVSLLRGMRRNIARDFRIREDLLHDEDQEESNGENNNLEQQNESRNPRGRVRAKRRRVS